MNEGEPKKKVHKRPENPGTGCPDLFNPFANDGLIEVEEGEREYYRRRGEWFRRQKERKSQEENTD